MDANTKQCLWMQNEIIASKAEVLVETLNLHMYINMMFFVLYVSYLLLYNPCFFSFTFVSCSLYLSIHFGDFPRSKNLRHRNPGSGGGLKGVWKTTQVLNIAEYRHGYWKTRNIGTPLNLVNLAFRNKSLKLMVHQNFSIRGQSLTYRHTFVICACSQAMSLYHWLNDRERSDSPLLPVTGDATTSAATMKWSRRWQVCYRLRKKAGKVKILRTL